MTEKPAASRDGKAHVAEPPIALGGRRQIVDLKSVNPDTRLFAKIAATLTDKLKQTNGIALLTREEWLGACILRDLHHAVHDRPSEGVGSYDLHRHDGDAVMMTSLRTERILNRLESGGELLKRYNDAVFAMVGVVDENGYRVIDTRGLKEMLRAILDSETPVRQDEVGQAVSSYKSGKGNKQVNAAGAQFVKDHLRRLALHFGLIRGEEPPR